MRRSVLLSSKRNSVTPKSTTTLLKPKVPVKEESLLHPQKALLVVGPKVEEKKEITKVYKMMWTKNTPKKQKTYNDGFIVVKSNNIGFLHDEEDKQIGKISNVSKEITPDMIGGESTILSGKLVEIMEEIPVANYLSGKLFLKETPTESALPKALPITKKTFLSSNAPMRKKVALYDKENPFAFVVDDKKEPPVLIDPYLGKHLRPHQVEGIKFMYNCVMRGDDSGCILADEMGLGKTLQTIALIWTLYKQCNVKKTVVVCPQSLIGNWENEFMKWLGTERIPVKTGSSDALMKQKVEDFINDYIPVLITSYEQVRSHVETLKKTKIGLLICDEGHRIKNLMTKTNTSLQNLGASRHIILSGTPVQNGLEDFYSLVEFCCPGSLGPLRTFKRVFATPIQRAQDGDATLEEIELGKERAKELTVKLNDYVLRRTSKINEKYLPDKTEIVVFVKPSIVQKKIYAMMLNDLKMKRVDQSAALQFIQLFTKLCNHPLLVRDYLVENYKDVDKEILDILNQEVANLEGSNKFNVTVKFIEEIIENSEEKVVVVSNYTKTLDVFEKYFSTREESKIKILRLDGKTSQKSRDTIVEKINDKKSGYNVLLLSSKAGGVGLNLIGCSRLILFDPDWNPAKDKQAMARIWRDGQKRKAMIYRMLCTGTIEEKIYQRQLQKNQVSESVVEEHLEMGKSLSLEQLMKVFELNENTLCDTHDLLQCDCEGSGTANKSGEKHLTMDRIESIASVDGLITRLKDVKDLISMLFVCEFHNESR
ncbi:DNA repair and recombination protein RDH54, putative [Entamoeba invadens IP1]|uniref:DNA repair and recombination protein RDH54, putative n=1 Tax=Entamoeba invadens IP1 TaxID=370355 RepID=A0A0A1U2T1_ENTIV|nr:DNA repair and recombination protein RDH54, putative [Entamoeba invadens IP1]ELP88334.1 DNA repair and recombination protein RDH54, putative [Entamoeba invadens IP1]|eukprot:XP_004255105.1 DNA repair and recombination protein RDH54, putative [Entamoeba invadens IP1]